MEAALKDFEDWLSSLPTVEVTYYAIFDNDGTVIGIYPDHAAVNIENKILIDREIAESVFEGKTTMSSYVVDLTSSTLEFVEIQTLKKIDDVLHRIMDKNWSSEIDNDICLTYNRKEQTLIIELSSKYTEAKNGESTFSKKVQLAGDNGLSFLLTHYNDPSWLIQTVSTTLSELLESKKIINDIDLPTNFSVYTRRLFKNYVVEEI
jgi:hypothetical protein